MDIPKAMAWLTNVLAVQGRELTLDDTRGSVAEWDSMGDLLLLSMLEEDHGIVVSADDVAAFTSTKDIVALLEKHNAFCSG